MNVQGVRIPYCHDTNGRIPNVIHTPRVGVCTPAGRDGKVSEEPCIHRKVRSADGRANGIEGTI
jgi:hypothetical protein